MRFECQPGCTNCCDQQGFVYLTEDDADRIAAFLGQSKAEFETQHTFRTKNLLRLRVPRHAQCTFLVDGRCSIHAVKPVQCRTFPFWPEILATRRRWHETGANCPGIGKGELVNIESAEAQAEEMRRAHPHLYP